MRKTWKSKRIENCYIKPKGDVVRVKMPRWLYDDIRELMLSTPVLLHFGPDYFNLTRAFWVKFDENGNFIKDWE